jgi:VIT1/CCC1 family predicted Fe2+/Mn2+ transporter
MPMDISHLIQSALAPVFLLSGVGVTLGVMTNRLARVVDRARRLEDRLGPQPGDAAQLHEDLKVLARRARYINAAITMCGCSAVLIALVVITLFANAFFGSGFAGTIALLFVGAMLFITGAYIAFLIEVRLATRALRIGVPL